MELFQKGVWLCSSEVFEDAALGQHSEDLLDELLAANPAFFSTFLCSRLCLASLLHRTERKQEIISQF